MVIPVGYNVLTFSSASKVTEPLLGNTTYSPWSYVLPYSCPSNCPSALSPSLPAVSTAEPGVNVLDILNAIGCPGVSISNLYVWPLYNLIVGLRVSPSLNTYAILSPWSSVVTVYVLVISLLCPLTGTVEGPSGSQ